MHLLIDDQRDLGCDIMKWAIKWNYLPKKVQLVTSNPVGRENMKNLLIDDVYITKDGYNFIKE